jgi:hypothetical protein
VLAEILEHTGLPWHEDVLTPRPDHVIGGTISSHGADTLSSHRPARDLPCRPAHLRLLDNRYSSRTAGISPSTAGGRPLWRGPEPGKGPTTSAPNPYSNPLPKPRPRQSDWRGVDWSNQRSLVAMPATVRPLRPAVRNTAGGRCAVQLRPRADTSKPSARSPSGTGG